MKKILFLLICLPSISFAQETAPAHQAGSSAEAVTLDRIEVRGNKEDKTYLESTESISVVEEQKLNSPAQSNSIQALNALPNFVTNKNDDSFSIRGINNSGVTGYQKDNLSSIVIDNIFQTDLAIKAGSFELWDINHVELYRGPQSTSQGVNSLAGSILLFHNAPQMQNEFAAKVGGGTQGKKEFGVIGNTVINTQWASRLSYNKDLSDGAIKNTTTNNSHWGFHDKDHAAWSLLFKPTETEEWKFDLKYLQNRSGGNYVQSANPFDREVSEDVDFISKTHNQQVSLQYLHKVDSLWNYQITSAYTQSQQNQTSDADGTSSNTAGVRNEDHRDHFASLEALLKYKSENVKNVLGVHLHDFFLDDDYNFNLLFPLSSTVSTPVATTQSTDKYRTVAAIFNSWLYRWDENQSVNLGLRYEYVQNKYGADIQAHRLQNLGGATNGVVDTYLNKVSGSYESRSHNSIVLPKLGYIFEVGADSYGASYSQGYRTGGLSINRSRAQTNEYNPELTHNFELSYKHDEGALSWASNVFYTSWRDQQVQVQLSNDTYDTQVTNAANSELYGAELESKYRLTKRQTLNLGAGYVKTRFLDFSASGTDYRNKEFPQAPRYTGQISYLFQFDDHWGLTNTGRYLSRSYSNAENTRISPEQYYWDADLQWLAGSFSTDLYIRNILGADYLLYDGRPKNAGTAYTAVYNQVNAPREIGARVTYYW